MLLIAPGKPPVIRVAYDDHYEWWRQERLAEATRFRGKRHAAVSAPSHSLTVPGAHDALRAALDRATKYLRLQKLPSWQQRFTEASAILDGKPSPLPFHRDLLATPSPEEHQLAAAALCIWVFTEQPFRGQRNDLLRIVWPELSRMIAVPVYDAIAAAANARMLKDV